MRQWHMNYLEDRFAALNIAERTATEVDKPEIAKKIGEEITSTLERQKMLRYELDE